MNKELKTLQFAIRNCLKEDDTSAKQIVEVFRECLKMEEDTARTTAQKARDALNELRVPFHYTSTPDWMADTAVTSEGVTFSAIAADGVSFTVGDDIITY